MAGRVCFRCGVEELELILAGRFLAFDGGHLREKSQARDRLDVALHMCGIFHSGAHHLVATTNTDHLFPILVGLDDGLANACLLDLMQIGKGVLCAGQDDDIRRGDLFRLVAIEKIEAGIDLQHVEIGEVGHSPQLDDRHINLAFRGRVAFLLERDRILVFDTDILEIGDNADDRDAGQVV